MLSLKEDRPVVGVIAGMGPQSTTLFLDHLYAECRTQYGASSDDHYPHIVVYSLPTPYVYGDGSDHRKISGLIAECATRLQNIGCDFLAMPCNTSHRYLNQIRDAVSIPILDMVEMSCEKIDADQRVGLIATASTIAWNGYQSAISKRGSLPVICGLAQDEVEEILSALTAGATRHDLERRWLAVLALYTALRVDKIVIGCTDLGVFVDCHHAAPHIDSGRILAERTIRTYIDYSRGFLAKS